MSEKITYDPSKSYTWTPQDVFELTGEEFGAILNTIRGVISTPEALRILQAADANNVIERLMVRSVEAGVVKEVVPAVEAE